MFPFLADVPAGDSGGPLYVPRERQGAGRHDQPDHYGALYVSRVAASAIAERIQAFRGQTLNDSDLRLAGGAQFALATFDDSTLGRIVDLDDPAELSIRQLRPSLVATRDRGVTRGIALRIFEERVPGFGWWSTLDAAWPNVTLFAERASARLALVGQPERLTVAHPQVRLAADAIGVRLAERE